MSQPQLLPPSEFLEYQSIENKRQSRTIFTSQQNSCHYGTVCLCLGYTIYKCLGQDFLPYMRVVMPPWLQSAQLKPDVTITYAIFYENIDESNDERIETVITLGDKRIGIKASVLEEKFGLCSMLYCYADEFKEVFYAWIDQVALLRWSLLEFYFHEKVKKAVVSAMQKLLRCAKLAAEKGQATGRDESYVKQSSDYTTPG